MPTILKGTMRGKIIELESESGLPEGQAVTIALAPLTEPQAVQANSINPLRRAAGSWSDDAVGLDRFLEWNRQQRKFPQ